MHLNPIRRAVFLSRKIFEWDQRSTSLSWCEGASMKRFWAAPAVALFLLGLIAGCNDYNNTVQYNTGATITNISPSSLPAGTVYLAEKPDPRRSSTQA